MKRYYILHHHETIVGCLQEINCLRQALGIPQGLNRHNYVGFSEPAWRRGSLQRWRRILMAQYRERFEREWAHEVQAHG